MSMRMWRYSMTLIVLLLGCARSTYTGDNEFIYNSCESAYKQGSNESGKHVIWKNGIIPNYLISNPSAAINKDDLDIVWCDLFTFGGGWTLIAYSDPGGNWPTIDYNFNPRRTSAALGGMEYSPEWEKRDHSFYRLFDTEGIQEDWIMFRAGDSSAYCAFLREDILKISLLGSIMSTPVLGSEGVIKRHGKYSFI
jgi:hypothetical protein